MSGMIFKVLSCKRARSDKIHTQKSLNVFSRESRKTFIGQRFLNHNKYMQLTGLFLCRVLHNPDPSPDKLHACNYF